jgi:hypothetical protein
MQPMRGFAYRLTDRSTADLANWTRARWAGGGPTSRRILSRQ